LIPSQKELRRDGKRYKRKIGDKIPHEELNESSNEIFRLNTVPEFIAQITTGKIKTVGNPGGNCFDFMNRTS